MFANARGESGIRAEEAATIQRQLETQPRPAQREETIMLMPMFTEADRLCRI